MGDGHDRDDRLVGFDPARDDDSAGAILAAFLAAFAELLPPKIGVRDDEAGMRLRPAHLIALLVEVVVARRHLGFGDRLQRFFVQVLGAPDQTALE